MRIWTKCVWDLDGRLIEDESSWFEYDGPVAQCGGGSETTMQPAQPTAEERALTTKQVELAEFQLTELQRQSELQQQFAAELQPLIGVQTEEAQRALARAERLDPIQEELLNIALEDLRRGGAATPEQIALIEEATGAALEKGLTDIERFETFGLEQLREELAPSLGLRPSDTPILDRGGRLGAEALRQRGQLSSGLREAGATARLNFPLAQSQLLQSATLGQSQLQEATRQFQEQLRNQAFQNRLALTGQVGGFGLGLAGVGPNIAGTLGALAAGRGSTSTTTGGFGLDEFGQVASGLGGLLTGLGAVGVSSKELKEAKRPVDEDEVLEKVERLPVERWRYKPGLGLGGDEHIGPYAEDFTDSFGLGDGVTINLMDAAGVTMAAVKALSAKVGRLEQSFGLRDASAEAHVGA